MPKVSPIQTNTNGGELSPLLYGRPDFDQYKTALKLSLNGIPLVQGGWTRRPGTKFVAEVKDSTDLGRLFRFEFSTTQAYVIEAGDQYFRFYKDHAQIVDSGAVEVATPYTSAQLAAIKWAQSNDILYLAHAAHEPRKLSRTSHIAWTLAEIDFKDGPYMAINTTATTLTLSGTSGSVTVTASATTGINSGAGFAETTDIGRLIRWKDPANNWTWLEITAWTSTTVVTATIRGPNASAGTATANWRLGLWSDTTGWPTCVTFYEDRLCWAGSAGAPQRVDMSRSGDYENMAPSDADEEVVDSHAVAITLNSNDVQVIRWMLDDEKGLLVGTVRGEWIVRPSSAVEALTPTNVQAKQSTAYGSADVQALRAGKAVLYVQRAGRKLRELAYVYELDGFRSPDMTVLAQHITRGNLLEIAHQQEPQSIVWAVRGNNDGIFLGFTYEREQKVVGWHRHSLGGYSNSGHTIPPIVESIVSIPTPDGGADETWLLVKRHIDGGTVRYIEYGTQIWEQGNDQEDAYFFDCGITYDSTATDTITGLDHLEGETVSVLADGARHPDCEVSGGEITLNYEASVVQVGYDYNSDGQTLRPEAGAADGTAQGKKQRTHRCIFRVHDTLGLKVGPSFDELTEVTFRTSADDTDEAVPLFSGDVEEKWEGDYTTENYICWRLSGGLPGTILAVMPQMATQDR